MDVKIDPEGWVSVKEILEVEFLKGVSLTRFLEVVAESNKQKMRYEMNVLSSGGQMIRASGKKSLEKRSGRPAPSRSIVAAASKAGITMVSAEPAESTRRPLPEQGVIHSKAVGNKGAGRGGAGADKAAAVASGAADSGATAGKGG